VSDKDNVRDQPIGERPGEAAGQSVEDNPNVAVTEQTAQIEAGLAIQLSPQLAAVRDRIVEAFGSDVVTGVLGFRGELTLELVADRITDVLRFCRDDADLRCELLADLSGVHWPGGLKQTKSQETTGWPTFEEEQAGRIEVDYILYSITHDHRFRLRVFVPDTDPRLPSAVDLYASASFMEREVYDFFGVDFTGHPDLRRILMPDEWEGHPHRKDYPLGGVEVQYHGATIPPPDQRSY
jgi:NADH-quinone oxidoreductase subunit C